MLSLSVDRVSKRYNSFTALDETSLSVREGEFLTLLGPSGSGKTTLLNLISGLTDPSTGRIHIGDKDVTSVPMNKRDLGMVFQSYALFPHMSIHDNVAYPLKVRGFRAAEVTRLVKEALDAVQLGHLAKRRPVELSGGQQQRVSLARAMVYRPQLILLDEPLGALDKNLRATMQYEIKELQKKHGITMVYVTHDQEEALSMSDQIAILRQGRIEQIGSPADLYYSPASLFCAGFLGEANVFQAEVLEEGSIATVGSGGISFKARNERNLRRGQVVEVVVRPENVSIELDLKSRSEASNQLQATLTNVTMVGSMLRVQADVQFPHGLSQRFLVNTLNRQDADLTGRRCILSWPPGATSLLPASLPGGN